MTTSRLRGRGVYLLAACLVVIVAQATLFSRIRVLAAGPDLLLVTVVCWSLVRGVHDGLIWAFWGGLGVDLIAGLPLGMSSLALLPTPWLGGLGRRRVFGSNALLPILLVALATPLRGWLMLLLQQARGMRIDWAANTLRIIGPELILNALLAVMIYPVVRMLVGQLSLRPAEI